jgi:chlorophyllide a oxygenase
MRDHWYPVCDTSSLPASDAFAVTLLGDPLALFRDATGAASCLEDRCAHRSAPLSLGRTVGGHVECPYHGWRFDAGGACMHVPSLGPSVPVPCARVRAYPCVERAGLVWVWPGDSALAAEREGVAWGALDEGAAIQGWRDLEVEHGLVIENLLDLAHAPFAHEGLLASREEACGLDVALTEDAGGVQGRFRRTSDGCESAQTVTFTPPCTVRFELELGWDEHRITQVHHAVPLARGRTRWMWRMACNWLRGEASLHTALARRAEAVIEQDARLLLAQQSRIDQGAPAWGCEVPADAAALAYRAWRARHERRDTWFSRFDARAG